MLGEAIQTILSLTLIIALIVGLSIMYKKFYFTKYSENAILKINTVLSVGLKEKLVIVECDAKKIFVRYYRSLHSVASCF